MMKSRIRSLSNTWHFYAILVALIGLSLISFWYLIVLTVYLLYLYKIRFINKFFIIIGCYFLISIVFLSLYNFQRQDSNLTGIVISVSEYEDYNSVVLLNGLRKIKVNYSKDIIPNIGNKVLVEGYYKELSLDEYSFYLKGMGIYQAFNATDITITGNSFISCKGYIISFYDKMLDAKSSEYFKGLILGIKSFDEEYTNAINSIGISYLFCISGFHISMIATFIDYVFKKIFPLAYKRDFFVCIFLLLYTILTGFSYGVLRAVIMFILTKINNYKHLGMSKLDICSASFLVITIINPMSLYSISLRLSYIITLMIILSVELINEKKGILRSYLMAMMSYLVSMPLVITMNNEINLLSLIVSPLYLGLFSFVILPLTYLLIIIPVISPIISSVYILFEKLIFITNNIELLKFTIKNLRPYEIIMYYTIYYLILRYSEKYGLSVLRLFIMVGLVFIMNINSYFMPFDKLIMLDVGQGDSILLMKSHNKGNLLIDSYNNLKILKGLGVKQIDTLIITHSDDDHFDTALDVIRIYNVKNIILSSYDYNAIKKVEALNKKCTLVSSGDFYNFKGTRIEFIAPVSYNSNINNNSLVFIMTVNSTKILFTGDMESQEEKNITKNNIDFDILKVPHHGSESSLSDEFYNKISFKDAIISVGKNNKFKHPSDKIIDKLSDHSIYRTDIDGQIYIYIYKKKYSIRTNIDFNLLKYIK